MLPLSNHSEMPPQWRTLYQEMDIRLSEVQQDTMGRLSMIRFSLDVCRTTIDALKGSLTTYTFQSIKEEIYFFKEVKPAFYSHLIYYLKLFNLEAGRPAENIKLWKPRLERVSERIQYFFDNHIAFCQYYRSGDTYLDAVYFTRQKGDYYLHLDDSYFSYDPLFSTTHDLTVARILANERVFVYVTNCLEEMEKGEAKNEASFTLPPMNWTATKAGLIELLYALQSAGVFNNGSSDLKQVASYFEQIFNIELGNYYNVFQEIRLRKKNRTSFLDQLKDRLTKRMDEADENGR